MNPRASLADDDGACSHNLAAGTLDAETLSIAVAAVARTADAFFMCHGWSIAPGAVCLIGSGCLVGSDDAVDLDLSIVLAMSITTTVVLPTFHLENDDLFASNVSNNGGLDGGTGNVGTAHERIGVGSDEQDVRECLFCAFFHIQAGHAKNGTLLNLKLLTGDIDYGVHDDRLFSCLRVMVAAGLSLRTDPERTDKGS